MDVVCGDCLEVMPAMDAGSVDAIVCDPPYGLSFMGKNWDKGVPGVVFWTEALRVAKPGAYLLAFGGTRTFHRLTCAIEDAGWEIRDCLSWLYGSGFPKSLDVSKAIDKARGDHREPDEYTGANNKNAVYGAGMGGGITLARASAASAAWDGWGTALKPAWEPVVMARKPFKQTVAANVQEHGTGAINIDACRIETSDGYTVNRVTQGINTAQTSYAPAVARRTFEPASGRWPANVMLDEEAAGVLDEQSGERGASAPASGPTQEGFSSRNSMAGSFGGMKGRPPQFHNDSGGASRFFYCAKSSRSEREAGLTGDTKPFGHSGGASRAVERGEEYGQGQEIGRNRIKQVRNNHPTVKPIALMRWLCRLVTPPNGLILDPFAGSGSTGCAAIAEGFRFIGIEKEAEYAEIARARIEAASDQGVLL